MFLERIKRKSKTRVSELPFRILTMHIPFMLIFNKAITLRLPSLLVMYHLDLFDRTVSLELAPDLRLAGVEVDSADEQSLEGVGRRLLVRRGVPESDLLLQLVRDLFFFFAFFALKSEIK